MSKRELTQKLAKEDCRRAKENVASIASQLIASENCTNMTTLIKKKSKANEECAYLKTADAWYKRFQSVTVAELNRAVDMCIVDENSQNNKLTEDVLSTVSQRQDAMSTVSQRQDAMSRVSRREDAMSTVSRREDAMSTISMNQNTLPNSTFEAENQLDTKSEISISDKKSIVSLAQSVLPDTEDNINQWYKTSLADLQNKDQRDEQYRRKRALLRAEYWTRMDKLRNNATPTVINF